MTLSMKVTGFNVMKGAMAKRRTALLKRKAVNARAVTVVDSWIQRNFKSEGGNVGGWRPLADSTKFGKVYDGKGSKGRPRGGESAKILQDTGTLRLKWNHIATNKEAAIESLAKSRKGFYYGTAHNEGGKNNRPPKRRILPENREIWPKLKLVYGNFIKSSLR